MLLRGDDGYFSREVTVDGTKFKIRELGDEAYRTFLEASTELTKAAGALDEQRRTSLYEDLLEALRANDSATREEIAGAVLVVVEAALTEAADPNRVAAAQESAWAMIDAVVVEGVVGWTLKPHECNADTVVLLPRRVKRQLMREILRDTQLEEEGQDFSSPSPRR